VILNAFGGTLFPVQCKNFMQFRGRAPEPGTATPR